MNNLPECADAIAAALKSLSANPDNYVTRSLRSNGVPLNEIIGMRVAAASIVEACDRVQELLDAARADAAEKAGAWRARRERMRNNYVTMLADGFEASGTEYTCRAVVTNWAAARIDAARAAGIFGDFVNHSLFSQRSLEKAVADMIHERWKAKR